MMSIRHCDIVHRPFQPDIGPQDSKTCWTAHRPYLDRVPHDPTVTIGLFENTQYIARRAHQRASTADRENTAGSNMEGYQFYGRDASGEATYLSPCAMPTRLEFQHNPQRRLNAVHLFEAEITDAVAESIGVDRRGLFS